MILFDESGNYTLSKIEKSHFSHKISEKMEVEECVSYLDLNA